MQTAQPTRRHSLLTATLAVAMAAPLILCAQRRVAPARGVLLDLLVWGADTQKIDPAAYKPATRKALEDYLRRYHDYRSTRAKPAPGGEWEMMYAAQVGYERRLVAISSDPQAAALAVAYVDLLKPCYEWEGYSDCPQREARFAAEYQDAHEAGPFSAYLPLLEAHRWLCAAEGYDYEQHPEAAAQCRWSYARALARARRSPSLLVRQAADGLSARGRCFATP